MIEEFWKLVANFKGETAQSVKCMEELGELIRAISRAYLSSDNKSSMKYMDAIENLAEEICDVEIMVSQIKHLYEIDDEEVEDFKVAKMKREKDRLNELLSKGSDKAKGMSPELLSIIRQWEDRKC